MFRPFDLLILRYLIFLLLSPVLLLWIPSVIFLSTPFSLVGFVNAAEHSEAFPPLPDMEITGLRLWMACFCEIWAVTGSPETGRARRRQWGREHVSGSEMWGMWEGEHAGGVIKEKAYACLVGSTVRGIKMMKEEQGIWERGLEGNRQGDKDWKYRTQCRQILGWTRSSVSLYSFNCLPFIFFTEVPVAPSFTDGV